MLNVNAELLIWDVGCQMLDVRCRNLLMQGSDVRTQKLTKFVLKSEINENLYY
jgi:hypothetical protein